MAQARRMCQDGRVRRLAAEFACQWLHIYDFDSLDEKSERHFPTFASCEGAMHEEAILYFTDLFQNDGSVLSVFDGDHTFLNEDLAKHYEIPGVTGSDWRRVDGVRKFGRGGILALAATLAKQSGASRTSPILRGNWVSEVLLGERLPRPPKNVPVLPDDEAATKGLTVRQLVEKHTSDPRCASCHVRIDPLGFALEAYDAIGRRRAARPGRPADRDASSALRDGTTFDGLDGLRQYLVTARRDAVDPPVLPQAAGLRAGPRHPAFRSAVARRDGANVEEERLSLSGSSRVTSRQFREIRGQPSSFREIRGQSSNKYRRYEHAAMSIPSARNPR